MAKALTINDKEKEILKFWNKDKTFEKSLEKTKDSREYVFYDGPPFATGYPHHGHLLASVVKDLIPRFWTMRGFHVKRRWGWDCHGLPVENIVEKNLKIKSKDEIEKMGVEKFNKKCRDSVLRYAEEWGKTIKRIARWTEFENSYKTMDNYYIESVWWAFKQLYEKDYIYKGEKVLMYCPHCVTPLAKSEISMDNSYKKVRDISLTVKLKLKDEDVYALAWTTTPWTLPSNLALAVNPEMDYAYVKDKSDGTTYLLARELIGSFFRSEDEYDLIRILKGREILGREYEPLFDYFKDRGNSFKFISGDFVTAEEGTGIVHTAPAFGEDDYRVCNDNGIEMVQPVDEKGRFTEEVRDFSGKYVHEVNEDIVTFLKEKKKVISLRKISHEYPFCYRCDTKLIYRALPAWFVNIQKIKPRMLELSQGIKWYPEFVKEGRFKHIVETAPDWNISRNRYWATAIPIWESETGERIVLGSIDELKQYAKNLPREKIDLHKDFLDRIILEKDGVIYKRISEVMDCWFESGSMPFAQFHYPFENKDYFERHLPAQYVGEYIGQTRTWFYYMLTLSTILFDKIPFENVQVTGNILAEDGSKMSKSKKNFTDPNVIMKKYGADTLRFYLMSSIFMNAGDANFLDRGVEEVYKKVVLMLYNLNNFYSDYKGLGEQSELSEHVLDKWIVSKVNSFLKEIGGYLEGYNTVKACSSIRNFVDDLSTWYVRNSRERFNLGDIGAKKTLRYVLDRLSKGIAPIIPFIAERIYQNLEGKSFSVHLQEWPMVDEGLIDIGLERDMNTTREITSVALRKRDQERIGIRWPLRSMTVFSEYDLGEEFKKIILEEVNVKDYRHLRKEGVSVALDTKATKELEFEGFAREISRKIQAARKDAKLIKSDEIELNIDSDFNDAIEANRAFILERVGARGLEIGKPSHKFDHSEEGKIRGKKFKLSFGKV